MATRYYLRTSGAAAVTVTPDAAWTNQAGAGSALALVTAKANGAIAMNGPIAFNSGQKCLVRQYVGPQIGAGQISGTFKGQMECWEESANDNVRSAIGVRVVSADGSVVRGTLLTVANNSTNTEFTSVEAEENPQNRKLANGTNLSAVTAENGDRIVIEIGFVDSSGTTPEGYYFIGDPTAGDLPEDETTSSQTTAPWLEFSANIAAYVAPSAGGFPSFYSPTNGATAGTFPQFYKPQ